MAQDPDDSPLSAVSSPSSSTATLPLASPPKNHDNDDSSLSDPDHDTTLRPSHLANSSNNADYTLNSDLSALSDLEGSVDNNLSSRPPPRLSSQSPFPPDLDGHHPNNHYSRRNEPIVHPTLSQNNNGDDMDVDDDRDADDDQDADDDDIDEDDDDADEEDDDDEYDDQSTTTATATRPRRGRPSRPSNAQRLRQRMTKHIRQPPSKRRKISPVLRPSKPVLKLDTSFADESSNPTFDSAPNGSAAPTSSELDDEDQEEEDEEDEEEEEDDDEQRESSIKLDLHPDNSEQSLSKTAPLEINNHDQPTEKAAAISSAAAAATTTAAEDSEDVEQEFDVSESSKRRLEALEALAKIEIRFAQLRDRLYIERMKDARNERQAVETGTHPQIVTYSHLISARRAMKMTGANIWLARQEEEFDKRRAADERAIWSWWSNARGALKREHLERIFSNRRKLERERKSIERPKDPSHNIYGPHGLLSRDIFHPHDSTVSGLPLTEVQKDFAEMGIAFPDHRWTDIPDWTPSQYNVQPSLPPPPPIHSHPPPPLPSHPHPHTHTHPHPHPPHPSQVSYHPYYPPPSSVPPPPGAPYYM